MKAVGLLMRLVGLLPFGVLYALSDVIFVLVYHVARYRRRVVSDNLCECFPELDEAERRKIARDFYRNFADYIVETLKLQSVSDEEMRRRVVYENVEEVDRVLRSGRSIVAYFSHCFNWEWAPSITLWSTLKPGVDACFSQVYRPLKNEWFDRWFLALRSRFHSESFKKQSVFRDLIMMRRDGMPSICGFMSDQKPSHGDPTYVLKFLNRPTAMITGTETVARRLDDVVMYMDMHKTGRGRYRVVMRMIAENTKELPDGEITRRYASMLETTIRRNPAIWLWSHKRWKIPVTLPDDAAGQPTEKIETEK